MHGTVGAAQDTPQRGSQTLGIDDDAGLGAGRAAVGPPKRLARDYSTGVGSPS